MGHPLGLTARLAAALVSGGLAVLTLRFIENPLRFAAPVRRSPGRSLALGGAATAVAVGVGLALLVVVPTPVGRGAPAAALDRDCGACSGRFHNGRLRRGGAPRVRSGAGRGRGLQPTSKPSRRT